MAHRTLADVMTRDVVTVREDTTFDDIVGLLTERHVSAVPVVDGRDRVLGVVSEADLLRKLEFADTDPAALAGTPAAAVGRAARVKAAACTAAGLMTAPAVTAPAGMPVTAAARMMEAAGVKRVPVVDEGRRLVGIASRRDLLTVFLRPDNAIRHEVVRGVLETLLWIAPTEVTVDVRHGVVYLDGELDRRSLAESVVGMVRAVDGVVDVVSRLTYPLDDTGSAPGG
ncbi:CBS domain-containing protein [Dactylosporangium sucinum]|uniref:CBS domain-containing protein n=1 Tax=Dactylosporangium sucinum TaxID=1424081 RepID=A0A917X5R6_9ACTN|nr:CBS domain-containing protein [Dactylosporangium sucinum]GGM68274.1 hypothetical protein GCM10007977_082570 [Dactylosporangium sucinum]